MSTTQVFYGSVGSVINGDLGGRTVISNMGSGPMVIGSGKAIVQARTLRVAFDSLQVTGSVSIEVTRGDSCTIEAQGEDNLVEFIKTELIGSTLHVGIKSGVSFTSHLPLKVVATTPSVFEVDLSGSGDVILKGLDQPELKIELRGSGDVSANGSVDSVALILQGSGDIDTRRLRTREASINLHGSGDIRAFASDKAKVRLHGSGDVSVDGYPKVRDATVSGSGDIDFGD